VPGVVKVVPLPTVSASWPRTIRREKGQGAAQGRVVDHRQGARLTARQDHRRVTAARARNLDDSSGVDFHQGSDAKGVMAGAAKTISAEFTTEHVAHACMEPMNATALVTGDKIEVWAPSQSPFFIFLATSVRLGYKPENVTSHVTLLAAASAGASSRLRHRRGAARQGDGGQAREGGVEPRGRHPERQVTVRSPPSASSPGSMRTASSSLCGTHGRRVDLRARRAGIFQQAGGKEPAVCEGSEIKYHVPNHLVEFLREQRGVDVGFWRAVGGGYTKFALETVIDECARAAKKIPLEYRLELLEKEPRGRKVLEEVAQNGPTGRGSGPRDARSASPTQTCGTCTSRPSSRPRSTARPEGSRARGLGRHRSGRPPCSRRISRRRSSRPPCTGCRTCSWSVRPSRTARWCSRTSRLSGAAYERGAVSAHQGHPDRQLSGRDWRVGLTTIPPAVANAVFTLTGKRLRGLRSIRSLLKA